jgi:hypothetical protein
LGSVKKAMLDQDIVQKIYHHYLTGAGNQTLLLTAEEREDFFYWFKAHASIYPLCNADPSPYLVDGLRPGRCFGNAQTVAVKHELSYVEGFFLARDEYIFHGFNLLDGQVLDMTVFNSPEIYRYNGNLPNIYCGVSIPFDLIIDKNADLVKQGAINIPFLIKQLYLNS